MKNGVDQFSTIDPNPALRVKEDGTIFYSNKAGELLLNAWGVKVKEKIPSSIGHIVKTVISLNSPKKMEFKVGKRVYLTVFHPLQEEKCVCISGFDISSQDEFGEKIQESESQKILETELSELIDIQVIQSLINEFYKFTHIPIGLTDSKGNVILGVRWQDICTRFHRAHPETYKHCEENETKISSGAVPGKSMLNRCKNNMCDVATSIIVGGRQVSTIFLGQFLFEDEPLDYELFRSQARKYDFDEKEYIAALEKVPLLSREAVETGTTLITTLANLISQLSYSNIKLVQSLSERSALVNALRESEKQERARSAELAVVLDETPAAVMITHDPLALKMTGNRLSYEWIRLPEGTNISKAVPDEKRPETHKLFKNGVEIRPEDMPVRMAASGTDIRDYEFDIVYPDGMIRHVLGNFRSLHDEQGKPQGAVAAMIDITERKKAEYALRKSEERYRMLFANMTEAFFLAEIIYNEDGNPFDFRFLEINPAFELQTGITKENILSESFREIFSSVGSRDLKHFVEITLLGKSANFEIFIPELSKYFDVYAFRPEKGKIAAIFKNVSDHKQMEEALSKSEEKYRNIVETSNEGISLNDGKGLLTYANQKMAEMLGYDINEIIGRNILDFVADIDDSVVTNSIQRQLQDNIQSYDFKLLRKDRSPLWVFVNIKSFFDDDGKFIGSLNMFTDISERKNAEMKLKETLDDLENQVRERTSELEKAYNSLKESEQSLTEAQKMAHIGNWKWDISTDKASWSEEMYRIFGLSPQNPTPNYKELFEYVHPEDRDYVINIVAKNEKYINFDFRIVLANGEERTVNMQTEIVYDDENIPIKTKGTIQDITERKLAEEKKKLLASIVESSNDAIGTLSLDGIITSWNKGAEQVYGYPQEEVLGKSVYIVAPFYLEKETTNLIEKTKQGEKIRNFETLRLRKDGKTINVSLTLSPLFDILGKLSAISIISRDITERKKIEEKLRESEEKYRNIVETSNEGIVVVDKESIITYLNKKMVIMLGYTVEECIGKPIWYFLTEKSKNIVKSNLIKRQHGSDNLYEAQLVHKDGSLLWVFINAKRLVDKNGEFMGSLGMLSDITKRKEAEEALIHSEKHYRLLFETMLQGVVYHDADSKIISMNPAAERILGKTQAEFLGSSSVGEEYHTIQEDGSPFSGLEHPAMVSLRTGREVQNVVMGVYNPREKYYRWINITAVPIFRTGEDKPFQVYTLFDDITERKKAQEEKAKFDIARKQEIHHRIKNNLQVISSLLDLQSEKFRDKKNIKDSEVLEAFKKSQDRVISMALIHEELHKCEGLDELNFSPYVKELTDSLLLTNGPDNTGVSLKMDLEENIVFNMDIAVPLGIIVNELVSNSLKYAFPGRDNGEIRIKLNREERDLISIIEKSECEGPKCTNFVLSVADNGIGIPEDVDIENLDSLGLQLVTSLVDQLDGTLELKRNNGTEFIIRFTVMEKYDKGSAPVSNIYSGSLKFLQ